MSLSEAQTAALRLAAREGSLERARGGYWMPPSVVGSLDGREPGYAVTREHGWAATRTVESLTRRGLLIAVGTDPAVRWRWPHQLTPAGRDALRALDEA